MKKNIFIILLLIIVLALLAYIGYDKFLTKEEPTKEEATPAVVKTDSTWSDIKYDDSRITEIYDIMHEFSYKASRGAGIDDFTNVELSTIGFVVGTPTKDDFKKTGEDQYGNASGTLKLDAFDKGLETIFNKKRSIDFNKVSSYSSYGAMVSYKLKADVGGYGAITSTCGFNIKSYDKATNTINVDLIDGCGGTSGPSAKIIYTKIASAMEKDDVIVVKEKAIYISTGGYDNTTTYNIYSDPGHTQYIDSKSFKDYELEKSVISVESYMDKASTITYTFKKNEDTNKYYFVSSIIE